VPEGDDKPYKYPGSYRGMDAVVVNKIDLLPYVDCDIDRMVSDARGMNPELAVLPLPWLEQRRAPSSG
ncbi:MAG: hydrogenase nickel incorporation protein HypB, partial [Chlorobiaceae bacterium]|nr:hydrogenase nickel incorporation protein HypB [Chlorobiaceae bacterium]